MRLDHLPRRSVVSRIAAYLATAFHCNASKKQRIPCPWKMAIPAKLTYVCMYGRIDLSEVGKTMYIDPQTVISPKNKVRDVEVLFDRGPVDYSWSIARLTYGLEERIGIRWNGDNESKKGVPLANAHPVWFILPKELAEAIETKALELNSSREADLLQGYRLMAADQEQEIEAEEWAEGLIGDAY